MSGDRYLLWALLVSAFAIGICVGTVIFAWPGYPPDYKPEECPPPVVEMGCIMDYAPFPRPPPVFDD